MRRPFQEGSVRKQRGKWIGKWWEDGKRRSRKLGRISDLSKSDAKGLLAEILAPINARARTPSRSCTLGEFVKDVYLPFYHRKWKQSTIMTNDDRVNRHLVGEFGGLALGDFSRDALQNFLDRKAAAGLSFSVVDHLRWDLSQVFGMAVADGYIARNPAEMLFTPREMPAPEYPGDDR
jgi:hypothetical protein